MRHGPNEACCWSKIDLDTKQIVTGGFTASRSCKTSDLIMQNSVLNRKAVLVSSAAAAAAACTQKSQPQLARAFVLSAIVRHSITIVRTKGLKCTNVKYFSTM